MAITDADKKALSDLVFRALDTIEEDYGEDAVFVAGALVFEVKVPGPNAATTDNDTHWHGNYESTLGSSPFHIAGLFRQAAKKITEDDE